MLFEIMTFIIISYKPLFFKITETYEYSFRNIPMHSALYFMIVLAYSMYWKQLKKLNSSKVQS
jgi:hypothetical protein